MSRTNKKPTKAARKKQRLIERFQEIEQTQQPAAYAPKVDKTPLRAKSEDQGHYLIAIKSTELTFGVGPAGTGKTYVAGALAASALDNKEIEKIVITRPAVEAEEALGFLPGTEQEKFAPYLQPFRDVLDQRLGKSYVDYLIKNGRIEAAPLAYMRGRTFRDSWVILDEAQNTTPRQMKMFLTRIGENCKVIVNGDPKQSDIRGPNGLDDAVDRLKRLGRVQVVYLDTVVRSGLVQDIIEAYEGK